jgi:4a-hydroxytetrahydrobiopterin dehydratase
MPAFTAKEIKEQLKARPDWAKRGRTIGRSFQFAGFPDSIDFVRRVARKAQKMNHHPDIDIRFDKVTLALSTHDEGGITEKDFSLAAQCDEIFANYFTS